MRLGCCGSLEDGAKLKSAGFDFVEVNVQAVLRGEEPDDAWSAAAPDPSGLALPVEAANCLVPGHMKVIGPQRDFNALRRYMRRVADRAQRLGIRRLVIGSGDARRRPDDASDEQVMEQLAAFVRMAGDACAAHDITLVIEHLCTAETDTINTLDEMRSLIERADHPRVAALIDSYHYAVERQTEQDILALGDRIRHVHVAEPVGRVQPGGHGPGDDNPDAFDFVNFFCVLCKVGYDQRVSIEASWSGDIAAVGPASADLLRRAWHDAGRCEP